MRTPTSRSSRLTAVRGVFLGGALVPLEPDREREQQGREAVGGLPEVWVQKVLLLTRGNPPSRPASDTPAAGQGPGTGGPGGHHDPPAPPPVPRVRRGL